MGCFSSVSSTRRVIDYVIKKYGERNVCQIITFGTMAARQSIRDVGRVMQIPYSEVDKIAKMMGNSVLICERHYAAFVTEDMKDDVQMGIFAKRRGPKHRSDSTR